MAPPTTGMQVDTSNRTEVIAFWNLYYGASEGAHGQMGWNGDYDTCNAGSNSHAHSEAVERRINFYRAMAGISSETATNSGSVVVIRPGDLHVPPAGTTKVQAAQRAALMFSWAEAFQTGSLSHDPPNVAPYYCWSASAWNAAKNGSLAVGFSGPGAIDAYMRENDPSNLSVWDVRAGHRRWLLKQGVTDFASGDVPGEGLRRAANVLYVVPRSEELMAVTPRFACWPSPGYFPDRVMTKQWSVSHPGADFGGATVSMRDSAGNPVSTVLVARPGADQGDPSIIWSVPDAVAGTSVAADTTYQIAISGIVIGGATVNHDYSVTVFDPDVLSEPLEIVGTQSPPLSGARYFFELLEGAESHALAAAASEPANWTAGAEINEDIAVTDGTSAAYDLKAAHALKRSGSRSFRLVFPSVTEYGEQSFIIEREVTGSASGRLDYFLQRGYMTSGTEFQVHFSESGGPWYRVDGLFGGVGDSLSDTSFKRRTVPLPEGVPVRVRFTLTYREGLIYALDTLGTQDKSGVFLDDISFSGADWTVSETVIEANPGENFVRLEPGLLSPAPVAGEVRRLRLRARIGGRDYSAASPLAVTFMAPRGDFAEWREAEFPVLAGGFEDDHDGDGLGNGLEYAFGLDPLKSSALATTLKISGGRIESSVPLAAARGDVVYRLEVSGDLLEWSEVVPQVVDGRLVGEAGLSGSCGYARWKVWQP